MEKTCFFAVKKLRLQKTLREILLGRIEIIQQTYGKETKRAR